MIEQILRVPFGALLKRRRLEQIVNDVDLHKLLIKKIGLCDVSYSI